MHLIACTFPFQRKAACTVRNLRYLKEDSRNIGLITGKKRYEQKNVGKVM